MHAQHTATSTLQHKDMVLLGSVNRAGAENDSRYTVHTVLFLLKDIQW